MPRRGPLHPDVALGVRLSATISRNRYTHDPEPVIAELLDIADGRDDILAQEAGTWAGSHGNDEDVRPIATALLTLPGVEPWVEVGRRRRGLPPHEAPHVRGD